MSQATATAAVAIIQSSSPQKSILILRRTTQPEDPWSGHFSFPGGRKESSDSDILATCLRETREETGILLLPDDLQKTLQIEPAGRNFDTPLWVQPFLFSLSERPRLHLETREIESGYWLEEQQFKDPQLHHRKEMIPGRYFPAFPLGDYYLWGFTYRLLQTVIFTLDQ